MDFVPPERAHWWPLVLLGAKNGARSQISWGEIGEERERARGDRVSPCSEERGPDMGDWRGAQGRWSPGQATQRPHKACEPTDQLSKTPVQRPSSFPLTTGSAEQAVGGIQGSHRAL